MHGILEKTHRVGHKQIIQTNRRIARYISIIFLVFEISSLWLASAAVHTGTWSKTPKTGFLAVRLKRDIITLSDGLPANTDLTVGPIGDNGTARTLRSVPMSDLCLFCNIIKLATGRSKAVILL